MLTIASMMWVAFIVFLGIKLITGIVAEKVALFEGVIYLSIILAGVIFLFAKTAIFKKIFKKGIKEGIQGAEQTHLVELRGRIGRLEAERSEITGVKPEDISARGKLQDKIDVLQEIIDDM